MIYLCVDKDGTEKISNNYLFRGNIYPEINKKHSINYPYPNKFKDKWYDSYTDGYYQVPKFSGVILPKDTIKILIGKELIWEDEPIKI